MNILITGALGHIGSALIRSLPETFPGAKIILIDDLSTQRYASLFDLPSGINYRFIEAKVQDVDFSNLLNPGDVLIHLAALTDAAGTANKPDVVFQNNFESTKCISEACLKLGVSLIFPSSTSVYGSQEALVNEDCKDLIPQSPYAECKIKEEEYLKGLFATGLKGAILRLGTIYGISSGMRFHTAVNKFCWQAVMNQPITIWETAIDQKRPYLSLEDSVNAIKWLLKNNLFKGQIYNIVSGNHTVRDVINIIKEHVPDISIDMVQHKIMNQLSYEVSSQKIQETQFSFKGDLAQGIRATINLLKNANGRN